MLNIAVNWVRSEKSLSERGVIATFNIDQQSGRELRQYLGVVATQCSTPAESSSVAEHNRVSTAAGAECSETTHVASSSVEREPPTVIILDNLHHVGSPALLADAFNVLLGLPLHDWYAYTSPVHTTADITCTIIGNSKSSDSGSVFNYLAPTRRLARYCFWWLVSLCFCL